MTFLEKLNQINQLLDKIKTINTNVSRSTGISILESDLIKQHLRSLYELYDELDNLKNETPVIIDEKVEEKVESTKQALEEKQPEISHTDAIESVTKKIEETIQPQEEKTQLETEIIVEETPVIEPVSTKVEVEKTPDIKIEEPHEEEPQVEEEGMSLFEKYQQTTPKKDINIKINQIKPLKQLISVNDKFIIIKELFGNAISKYDAMVQEVDKMESKSSALEYMEKEVWNTEELKSKEDIIERVMNILDRKFVGQ